MLNFLEKLQPAFEFAKLHRAASEVDKYLLDERAAVYEFDGNLTRLDAEARAVADYLATKTINPIASVAIC